MSGGPESRSDERYSQPGLEVLPDNGLEVAHHGTSAFAEHFAPEAVPHEYYAKGSWYGSPEVVPPKGDYDKFFLDASPLPLKEESPGLEPISTLEKNKSRLRVYVLIVVLVLVLVGGIVGGVVGGLASRHHNANSEGESTAMPVASNIPTGSVAGDSTTSPTPTPTPTPTLLSLQSNSRLAVSGWRADGGFKIRLFYQDKKDNLRFSDYSSDEGRWSSSNKISAGGIKPGTPIGAGAHVPNDPPQYESFWLNSSSMLTGQNFRDGVTPLGGVWDSVDIFPVSVKETSQLAMYWPYAVMQDGDNGFRLVTYLGAASGGPWTNRSLGVSGPEGTGMAIIPRTSTYKAPSTAGLLYRGIDGILAGYSVQWDLPGLDWDFDASSTIPQGSAIAAFAVAKENDSNNGTNSYVVYQNEDNDIELLAYDDAKWTADSAALKGADAGTDIACLTEAMWISDDDVLSSTYDMSRCYFR